MRSMRPSRPTNGPASRARRRTGRRSDTTRNRSAVVRRPRRSRRGPDASPAPRACGASRCASRPSDGSSMRAWCRSVSRARRIRTTEARRSGRRRAQWRRGQRCQARDRGPASTRPSNVGGSPRSRHVCLRRRRVELGFVRCRRRSTCCSARSRRRVSRYDGKVAALACDSSEAAGPHPPAYPCWQDGTGASIASTTLATARAGLQNAAWRARIARPAVAELRARACRRHAARRGASTPAAEVAQVDPAVVGVDVEALAAQEADQRHAEALRRLDRQV